MIIIVKSQFYKAVEIMEKTLKTIADNSEIATEALIEKMTALFPQIGMEPIRATQPVIVK